MTDRVPTPSSSEAHASHDLLLIAAFAAGDVSPTEAAAAETRLATCATCAELAADLRSISRAAAELPRIARPRDFTLRPADAARLRPIGWRRLAAAFGARRLDVTRPLAAGLMTVGLAGLLLATLPSFAPGTGSASLLSEASASSQAGDTSGRSTKGEAPVAASAAASGAASNGGAGSAPGVTSSSPAVPGPATAAASPSDPFRAAETPRAVAGALGGTASPSANPPADTSAPTGVDAHAAGSGVNLPLAIASAVAVALGLGLFLLRRAGRSAGPR